MAEARGRSGGVKNAPAKSGGEQRGGGATRSGASRSSAQRSGSGRSGVGRPSGAPRAASSRGGAPRDGGAGHAGGARNTGAAGRARTAGHRDGSAAQAPQVPRWRPIAALVLSLAGFADAMYLTLEHFTGSSTLVCSSVLGGDCAKVTTSSESMIFGIFPVSLLGLIFFTAMIAINVPPMWKTSWSWVPWVRLGMAVGGMGFVLYLLYAELLQIKAICWWCTGVHVITFCLFVLIVSSVSAMFGSQWGQTARAR
jgi:uncharacterized membrane protein